MKILIVGMNPSAIKKARKSTTGIRLRDWMENIGFPEYDFTNVSDRVGDFGYGEHDVKRLREKIEPYTKIIALGNTVSHILKKQKVSHFKLPHPSGRNRLLNSKDFLQSCLKECRAYLDK